MNNFKYDSIAMDSYFAAKWVFHYYFLNSPQRCIALIFLVLQDEDAILLLILERYPCLSWAPFVPAASLTCRTQQFLLKMLFLGGRSQEGKVGAIRSVQRDSSPSSLLMGVDTMCSKSQLWKENQNADCKEDTQLSPQGISENCIIDSAS